MWDRLVKRPKAEKELSREMPQGDECSVTLCPANMKRLNSKTLEVKLVDSRTK